MESPMMRTALAVALATALLSPSAAGAGKQKRKKPAATQKVDARAIGELMGPFKFGRTPNQVTGVVGAKVKEKYADRIKETRDVYAQDRLRRDERAEIKRIRDSLVEFKGEKTGWDVSIIDDQFAHDTDESMMVYWENDQASGRDQRRFFFFHGGKLYKMFIAMNSAMLKGDQRKFEYFQTIMEQRYGDGTLVPAKGRSSAYLD